MLFFHVWNIMASGCIMISTEMTILRQQDPIFFHNMRSREEKLIPGTNAFMITQIKHVSFYFSFCTAPSQLRLAWLHRLPGAGYPERRCDQPVQLQARLQHRHHHIATLCQVGDSPATTPCL